MNMGKRVPRIIEKKAGVVDARRNNFFPRSLQLDPGLDTHTRIHTSFPYSAKSGKVGKTGWCIF